MVLHPKEAILDKTGGPTKGDPVNNVDGTKDARGKRPNLRRGKEAVSVALQGSDKEHQDANSSTDCNYQ